jgi:hypothetical protein
MMCKHMEKSCQDINLYLRAAAAVSLLKNKCAESYSISTLTALIAAENIELRRFAVGEIGRLKLLPLALEAPLKLRLADPDTDIAAMARRILRRGIGVGSK